MIIFVFGNLIVKYFSFDKNFMQNPKEIRVIIISCLRKEKRIKEKGKIVKEDVASKTHTVMRYWVYDQNQVD